MRNIKPILARSLATVLSLALVNMCVPFGIPKTIKDSLPKPPPVVRVSDSKPKAMPRTRPLSAKEMAKGQGKYAKNPYLAGTGKWDPVYKGVNLITHNFTTSATDLSFEGGYGIPVNVTRSYSANCGEEGPLGEGWNLSTDVRTTAGGLLKSSGAPVRSVPNLVKNRPSAQTLDPNLPSSGQPVQAVTATDASGKEETIQQDVDGILTTPAWDTNIIDNHFVKYVDGSGAEWELIDSCTVKTIEGTVYEYANKGYYSDANGNMTGMVPFNNPSATAEPSYVLKIVSATDRHGNVTTYHYKTGTGNSNQAKFQKQNGITVEQKLDYVEMPNGHVINFTWGDGSSTPYNRVIAVSDNSAVRTVHYTYSGTSTSGGVKYGGELASSQTPAGLTTQYGYGSASAPSGTASTDIGGNCLTTITDPRGLTTTIHYMMDTAYPLPYNTAAWGPLVYRIEEPNGINTYFYSPDSSTMPSDYPDYIPDFPAYNFHSRAGGPTGEVLNVGLVTGGWISSNNTCRVWMKDVLDIPITAANSWYRWRKTYDVPTQSLQLEETFNQVQASDRTNSLDIDRFGTGISSANAMLTSTTTTYNFMGNPLNKAVDDWYYGSSPTATKEVQYAYWGADKYFQQKATRMRTGSGSSAWRYSFTDYNDSSASAGSKGQTSKVYDPKYGGIYLDTGASVPSGGVAWRYQVTAPSGTYSGSFTYDTKGRPTDVYKLQSVSGSTYNRVRTNTTYGSDTDGSWGQASQVVEDYGGINRTTQTTHYTSWGVADEVLDSYGHTFATSFDLDGKVQSVTRTDTTPDVTVATYTYGSSGITNGMVTQIVDGLSGVTQNFTYQSASGGGLGQPSHIEEINGTTSYDVYYDYNVAGEREYANYVTPNDNVKWWYHNYVHVGNPDNPTRIFQTLTKMSLSGSTWSPTSEEFHYAYDTGGRLREAAFAQTPSATSVLSNGTYYDASHLPTSRAEAWYAYDSSGRMSNLEHWWKYPDGSGGYLNDALLGNAATYSDYLGLKASSAIKVQSGSNIHAFTTSRTEYYDYDADLDYLTSADYNDGLANENPSWSYDAAGNRNDVTAVDNLNRATTIGGVSRTYDILGNTLTKGSTASYTWDCLNRMSSGTFGSSTYTYDYRADGMRVRKSFPSGTAMHTDYSYDGQMPIEEFNFAGNNTSRTFIKLIQYGLGARGIDRIERTPVSGASIIGYPLYDGHGNMVACLFKGSGNTCSLANQRSYDAWGVVRSGNTTGEPNGRYCANLGHIADDESGLTYMRARYYEPGSGRFVSEDPNHDGQNYYSYCDGAPVDRFDRAGRKWEWLTKAWGELVGALESLGLNLATVIGTIFLIKPVAAMFEVLYEAAINSEARQKMDRIYNEAYDEGRLSEEAWLDLKQANANSGTIADAGGVIARFWQVLVRVR